MRIPHIFTLPLLAVGSLSSSAWADDEVRPQNQSELPITINDGQNSADSLTFDWPTISVGTGQYEDGPTGLTIIRFADRVRGVVDARGGGPGTVNSDYINLGYDFPEIDAVVFAGGSFYGLEAVTAVTSALKDSGERTGYWDNIGLATGSIIYDFGGRRLNEIYPDKRLAQAALGSTQPGWFPVGPYGAGRSAVFGGIFGCNARSGQGAAFRQIGDVKIAVFTVVNALGVVTDRQGRVVACHRHANWPEEVTASWLMQNAPDSLQPGWPGDETAAAQESSQTGEGRNTTVSLVVTNRKLSNVELKRLAAVVHTSMARAIQPFATERDGDVLYAITTDEVESGPGNTLPTDEIGIVASELMWDAILAAVPEQQQHLSAAVMNEADSAQFARFAGRYDFGEGAVLEINHSEGALRARAVGNKNVFAIGREEPVTLTPAGADVFMVPGRYPFSIQFSDGQAIINQGRWQQSGERLARD